MHQFSFAISPTYRSAAAGSGLDHQWARDGDARALRERLDLLALASMSLIALWIIKEPEAVRELVRATALAANFLVGLHLH